MAWFAVKVEEDVKPDATVVNPDERVIVIDGVPAAFPSLDGRMKKSLPAFVPNVTTVPDATAADVETDSVTVVDVSEDTVAPVGIFEPKTNIPVVRPVVDANVRVLPGAPCAALVEITTLFSAVPVSPIVHLVPPETSLVASLRLLSRPDGPLMPNCDGKNGIPKLFVTGLPDKSGLKMKPWELPASML